MMHKNENNNTWMALPILTHGRDRQHIYLFMHRKIYMSPPPFLLQGLWVAYMKCTFTLEASAPDFNGNDSKILFHHPWGDYIISLQGR